MAELTIEKFLIEKIGLPQKATKLYLALLKYGSSSILDLAEYTNINRSTVNVAINYLTHKKLINQVSKGKGSRKIITAEPPEKFRYFLQQKKDEIDLTTNQLPEFIKKIACIEQINKENAQTEIRYYQGKNEVRFIYDEALKAKEFKAYVDPNKLSTVFPGNMGKFVKTLKERKNMHMWEILKESKQNKRYIAQLPKDRYEYQIARKELELAFPNIDYMMFDGKVAIVDLTGHVSGTLLINDTFYRYMTALFDFVWNVLKKHKTAI